MGKDNNKTGNTTISCSECRSVLFARAEELLQQRPITGGSPGSGRGDITAGGSGTKAGSSQEAGEPDLLSGVPAYREMEDHLQSCPACASLAKALQLTTQETGWRPQAPAGLAESITKSLHKTEHEETGTRRFFSRPVPMAAAAAALVVLSVMLTLLFTGVEKPTDTESAEGAPAAISRSEISGEEAPAVTLPESTEAPQETAIIVHLRLEAPEAESVSVVGDWNGWDPQEHRMHDKDGNGIWELRLKIHESGEYQYQFLVNGKEGEQWIPDPKSPLQVSDGFGGTNSILDI
ncbi:MAG: isoamylase early set domain-containing protein [Spirochaetales bacterium]|nr:isoamylase early set domain-containing protein [Spirochaetales bacterium]MCF7939121.1 isoamylase early set domain-containing protein [Spirochaetales bacterium]